MGSSTSKFRKALLRGDEVTACQVYVRSPDLREKLDPNVTYGEAHNHSTVVHFAAKYAMKSLLRDFLLRGGNPNKPDSTGKTALHHLMICSMGTMASVDQRRSDCFCLLLKWSGKENAGVTEKLNLLVLDNVQNSALHYAAASGLMMCVQSLVAHGAELFQENDDHKTACETSEMSTHFLISAFLEVKMVFQEDVLTTDDSHEDASTNNENEEYRSMCELDLQEAKDQLIVETADMLKVPLFTAQALLSKHEWSRIDLLESWMSDKMTACQNAGVELNPEAVITAEDMAVPPESSQIEEPVLNCSICETILHSDEKPVYIPCKHEFCRDCVQRYLSTKIVDGITQNIQCPASDCQSLIPVEICDNLISREMASRYLKFDIKAFVDTNPNLKWCPHPDCGLAVRLNDTSQSQTLATAKNNSVNCSDGHFFCWSCDGEAHDPCDCKLWQKWQKELETKAPEQGVVQLEETEAVANQLWMSTHSKQCPHCRSRIQKNEGCNHIFCLKCKHDFCWVCLEPWRLHSAGTGGYFRCNRFEAVEKVQKNMDAERQQAEDKSDKVTLLNRFLHYYTRYANHTDSFQLECKLLCTTDAKMRCLSMAARRMLALDNVDASFIRSGMRELLKSRLILRGSYPYGYFLENDFGQRTVFEFMQDEVETFTEDLSQMIAKAYLKTPRNRVIDATKRLTRKRREFTTAIARGLIPPDEDPVMVRPSHGAVNISSRGPIEFADESYGVREALARSLNMSESSRSAVFGGEFLDWLVGAREATLDIGFPPLPVSNTNTNIVPSSAARLAWGEQDQVPGGIIPPGRSGVESETCTRGHCSNDLSVVDGVASQPDCCPSCQVAYGNPALSTEVSRRGVAEQEEQLPYSVALLNCEPLKPITHVAQFDYKPVEDDELALHVGDVIDVLDHVDPGWFRGKVGERTGVYPAAFVVQVDANNAGNGTASNVVAGSSGRSCSRWSL